MADFDGERGRENGHIESVCAVSPGNAHSQGPLGRRESGPATATGGLQTIREASKAATTRLRLLGFALSALAQLVIGVGHRAARNGNPVASTGLQAILAMEIKG